jgi:predicted HicB family RNase H-like nuclease
MSQNRSPAAAASAKHEAKDYQYSVGWSEEDQAYIGTVAEFPSLAAHGDSFEDALKEILTVVTDVLVDLRDSGERVPEPFGKREYSGTLNVRMPKDLHRKLAIEAARQEVSLNQWIISKLASSEITA